jgi:hypothetical protein
MSKSTFFRTTMCLLFICLALPATARSLEIYSGGWANFNFGVYDHFGDGRLERLRTTRFSSEQLDEIREILSQPEDVLNSLPAEIFMQDNPNYDPTATSGPTSMQRIDRPAVAGVSPFIIVDGERTNNFDLYLIEVGDEVRNGEDLEDFISRPIEEDDLPPVYTPVVINIQPSLSIGFDAGATLFKYMRVGAVFSYTLLEGNGYENFLANTGYRNLDNINYTEQPSASSSIFAEGKKISAGIILGAQISTRNKNNRKSFFTWYLDYGLIYSQTSILYGVDRNPIRPKNRVRIEPQRLTNENAALGFDRHSDDETLGHLVRLGINYVIPKTDFTIGAVASGEIQPNNKMWFLGGTFGVKF